MLQGLSLTELAVELDRRRNTTADYLVPTQGLKMVTGPGRIGGDGEELAMTQLRLDMPDDVRFLNINYVAHTQIAERTGVPVKYYRRMLQTQPELLAQNVNTWLTEEPDVRMVRTLDGTARAFLSDKYHRIDNTEIAEAVLPMIGNMPEATVESCQLTDKRMYLKILNPRVQAEIVPGDVVQSGFLISNSEVGCGTVTVMPLVYRLICKNGMIANDTGLKKYHVGRVNEADENFEVYRSETLEAEDKAFVLKLQDTVRATADIIQFQRIVTVMKGAADAKMTTRDIPKTVQLASKSYGLSEGEGKGVLNHLIMGRDLSLYGLANAVTRQAQDIENYDRSTDLEMAGWDMLNMPRSEWTKINQA